MLGEFAGGSPQDAVVETEDREQAVGLHSHHHKAAPDGQHEPGQRTDKCADAYMTVASPSACGLQHLTCVLGNRGLVAVEDSMVRTRARWSGAIEESGFEGRAWPTRSHSLPSITSRAIELAPTTNSRSGGA